MIVISGVAGMTGGALAEQLLSQGKQVFGFDNFFAGSRKTVRKLQRHARFVFKELDISVKGHLDAVFDLARQIQSQDDTELTFVNCAAVVHTKHFYSPDETFEVNVSAMRQSLEQAIRRGFKTYINCSTSEVYSMNSWVPGGVKESDPVLIATAEQSLRTSYAAGKLLTEFFLRDAVNRQHISGCSIRFANVYSPDEVHQEHVIPHIISSLEKCQRVVLLDNARDSYRTFLHNRDSCSSILALLANPIALDGSVYNVGSEEEIRILDLVSKIADVMGLDEVSVTFQGSRSADPLRRLLSVEKIRKVSGWSAEVALDEGLRECVSAFRSGLS